MPRHQPLHAAAAALKAGLLVDNRRQRPEALLLYVDGSYCEPQASWSVVCLSRHQGIWYWWGFFAGPVDERFAAGDAFTGELYGQLAALSLIAHEQVPSVLCYDCESAACVAQGRTATCAEDTLRRAVVSTTAFLEVKGCAPRFLHTKAHTGNPGNEMADHLAKTALGHDAGNAQGGDHLFDDYVLEGALDWLWAFPACETRGSMPVMADDSSTVPCELKEAREVVTKPAHWGPSEGAGNFRETHLRCQVATYNTLSSATCLQRQCLDVFMHDHGLAVFGLQECRHYPGQVHKVGRTLRFASKPIDGQLGCQLWFNASPAFGWVLHAFRVAFEHPRLLVVYAKWADCPVACFSGHCPTSTAPREERRAWWNMLRARLAALPAHTAPILLLDANARFAKAGGVEVARNANAEALAQITADFGLSRSDAFDQDGSVRRSWRPPAGSAANAACLDYVLWPSVWDSGVTDRGLLSIVDEHVEIDHQPIAVRMQLHFRREVQRGNQVDREAMRSEAGRQALQLLFATVPDIPWATPVDDHVCQLNRHLQSGIRDLFPAQPQRPRKPTISERTWALLHAKRQQRRCHRRRKTLFAKWFLAQCFQAWRGAAGPGHIRAKVKTFDQVAATHMRQMRELTTAARQAQKEDDAAFVRQMFREAKAQGPVAIAQQVRAVLRSGRNAKIVRPTIALDTAEGWITEPAQVQAAFASHFGQAEAATQRPLQDICRRPLAPVQGVVLLESVPTLASLTAAFASLKPRKAAGIAGIPSEVYSQAPLAAALAHMTIMLKVCCRDRFPTLWSGLKACALPKPNKPQNKVEGYRSVALVEPAAKGVFKAIRPALSAGLERIAMATVGGARRGHPTDLAALSTQLHLSWLRRHGRSGAVLYIDGISAFYAVDRAHLFSSDLSRLRDHISQLALEEPVRQRVLAAISEQGALDRAGVPKDTQRMLQAAFQATWFAVDVQQEVVQATQKGTTPGSPLADILYQFVSEVSMRCLAEHMADEGLAAMYQGRYGACCATPQSWLDDVALLIGAPDALSVAEATARVAGLAQQYLAVTGVAVNYGVGKTEAIVVLAGKGAAAAKRTLFATGNGQVCVRGPDGSTQPLRCVAEYTHLGAVRSHTASSIAAICKREEIARELYQPFKRRILANAELEVAERQELFRAIILARFLRSGDAGTEHPAGSRSL